MPLTALLNSQPSALAAGLALAMATLPAASAHPWSLGVDPYAQQPIRSVDPSQSAAHHWADSNWVSSNGSLEPLSPTQWAQRCNTGRLVGGLLGGGLGYGMSRQGGRAWAVPLGALLGSQMGCSAAVGRGPRPW